jgi:hypothetical protein
VINELFSNERIVELGFSSTNKIKINLGLSHTTDNKTRNDENGTQIQRTQTLSRCFSFVCPVHIQCTAAQLQLSEHIMWHFKKHEEGTAHSWQWPAFYSSSDQDDNDDDDDDDDDEEEEEKEKEEEVEEAEEEDEEAQSDANIK